MKRGVETFVVALARASKRAKRFLRDLSGPDKDDVVANAILWCWEHRTSYDPSVPLDDWFLSAIRHARRDWELNESRSAAEIVDGIGVADDTSWHTEVEQAMQRLAGTMDDKDRSIVRHMLEGCDNLTTLSFKTHLPYSTVQRRLDRMRSYVPESQNFKVALRKTQPRNSDYVSDELGGIDREIERLEFSPPVGQNCSPCWRCKWFEGRLPLGRVQASMKIAEPEVRAAVSAIEDRKLEIAKAVRAGTINLR
jgi:DNA-directed RNA polymerase specialized sigma24 family protein